MQTMIKVAAVQMVSTPLPEENKQTAARYIREAAEQGASLVLLPEYWAILGQHDTDKGKFRLTPWKPAPFQLFNPAVCRSSAAS